MNLKIKDRTNVPRGFSIGLDGGVPPLLSLTVGTHGSRKVVHWTVRCPGQPNDRLMLSLDAEDGHLVGIDCPRVTPQACSGGQSFEFLSDGAEQMPMFDLTPWTNPDIVTLVPIPTIEVNQRFVVRIGETAFGIQIGDEQQVAEVLALGKVRLGFSSEGELTRIDAVELSSERMAATRSWLGRMDARRGMPPTPVRKRVW